MQSHSCVSYLLIPPYEPPVRSLSFNISEQLTFLPSLSPP